MNLFFLRLCHFLGKNLVLSRESRAEGRGMAELFEPGPPRGGTGELFSHREKTRFLPLRKMTFRSKKNKFIPYIAYCDGNIHSIFDFLFSSLSSNSSKAIFWAMTSLRLFCWHRNTVSKRLKKTKTQNKAKKMKLLGSSNPSRTAKAKSKR